MPATVCTDPSLFPEPFVVGLCDYPQSLLVAMIVAFVFYVIFLGIFLFVERRTTRFTLENAKALIYLGSNASSVVGLCAIIRCGAYIITTFEFSAPSLRKKREDEIKKAVESGPKSRVDLLRALDALETNVVPALVFIYVLLTFFLEIFFGSESLIPMFAVLSVLHAAYRFALRDYRKDYKVWAHLFEAAMNLFFVLPFYYTRTPHGSYVAFILGSVPILGMFTYDLIRHSRYCRRERRADYVDDEEQDADSYDLVINAIESAVILFVFVFGLGAMVFFVYLLSVLLFGAIG